MRDHQGKVAALAGDGLGLRDVPDIGGERRQRQTRARREDEAAPRGQRQIPDERQRGQRRPEQRRHGRVTGQQPVGVADREEDDPQDEAQRRGDAPARAEPPRGLAAVAPGGQPRLLGVVQPGAPGGEEAVARAPPTRRRAGPPRTAPSRPTAAPVDRVARCAGRQRPPHGSPCHNQVGRHRPRRCP